jgi:hypothetical protein
MKTRSSNDEIRLRIRVSGFPSFLDEQTPLEHDVFSHLKNALLKHWSDFVREPIVQVTADVGVGHEFNAEADFGEGNAANEQPIERLRSDEGDDLAFRLRPP